MHKMLKERFVIAAKNRSVVLLRQILCLFLFLLYRKIKKTFFIFLLKKYKNKDSDSLAKI
jgi:hypothetical protein